MRTLGSSPSISARNLHLRQRTPTGPGFQLRSLYQEIDLMKKVFLITLLVLAFGMFAMAQIQNPTSDVLGAHLNYGRGCAACHAPHSGARGNGIATSDMNTGNDILWGQDVQPL